MSCANCIHEEHVNHKVWSSNSLSSAKIVCFLINCASCINLGITVYNMLGNDDEHD